MADYINSNILSQAYFHIDPECSHEESALDELKAELLKFARSRTAFFLHPDAHVQIVFEEGSLKGRITVLGTIGLLMHGVATYKDFREGIQLIYSDSKRLSEYIISEALFVTGSKHDNVVHLESRTGVIGSVQKIIFMLEQVKRGADGSMSAPDIVKKIDEASDETSNLINNISDHRDRAFIVSGMLGLINELPNAPTSPKRRQNTTNEVAEYQNIKKRFIDWLVQKGGVLSADIEIKCIKKGNQTEPHECIQGIGGINQDGSNWYLLVNDAIAGIEAGKWKFWTAGDGVSVWVVIATHAGHKYLKTVEDGIYPNNLLCLPVCP